MRLKAALAFSLAVVLAAATPHAAEPALTPAQAEAVRVLVQDLAVREAEPVPTVALKPRRHGWPGWFARWGAGAMPLSEAERGLAAGEFESAYQDTRDGPRVYLTSAADGTVRFFLPLSAEDTRAFAAKARANGIEMLVEDGTWADSVATALKILLIVVVVGAVAVALLLLERRVSRGQEMRFNLRGLGGLLRRRARAAGGSTPAVIFADVAGQEAAKESLREIVDFLREPARFGSLGARVPKGVLLEGDPGNGKTLLARAVAGEAGVPFFQASGAEFVEMYVGVGARRVRDLFAAARKAPAAIVFIDEIDVVGRARSSGAREGGSLEHDQTINQLLTELDGFDRSGNIVLIAATNRAEVLDSALTRPGRIDRRVFVPSPDVKEREAILGVHARRLRLASGVSLAEVAGMTPGFSGADLANVLNEAALAASRRAREAVGMEEIRAVMDKILLGEKRPAGAMTAEERRVVAYHEAGHAIVALRTPGADPVRRVTIVPRGRALGAVLQTPDRDRHLWSRGLMRGRLDVLMAGRAAEEIILDHDAVTGGAAGDITQATRIAREMLGRYGMSGELGCVDLLDASRPAAPATLERLDRMVEREIAEALSRARAILLAEAEALHALAQRLLREETLSGEEAAATVGAAGQSEGLLAA